MKKINGWLLKRITNEPAYRDQLQELLDKFKDTPAPEAEVEQPAKVVIKPGNRLFKKGDTILNVNLIGSKLNAERTVRLVTATDYVLSKPDGTDDKWTHEMCEAAHVKKPIG